MPTYKQYTYAYNKDPVHETTAELTPVDSDEILIRVSSAALNPIDLLVYYSAYYISSWFNSKQGIGRDYSGTIESIGATAASHTGLKVGDEVFGLYRHFFQKGTIAEYIKIKPMGRDCSIAKIPKGMSKDEAAAVPLVFGTANQMMADHDLKGAKVLVLGGATSVGRYVIQLARIKGAREIITSNGARSNELVRSLGSTKQLDYNQHPNLLTPVLEATKEGKFNYIYDCAGNCELFGDMKDIVDPKKNDFVTIVGDHHINYAKDHLAGLAWPFRKTVFRQIGSKLGLVPYNYRFFLLKPGNWLNVATSLYEQGELQVFVDSTYKFQETPQAVEKLSSGAASGKVVIQVRE
ncbi:hypothetical protein DIURU_002688 [Diutina rugosa]|uniref:Enoyl reductase (ER) domain-containing protein n=1 Tax=Diutina rugosa TaxID=5481 RepID=A0A642UPC5_DIURU|nr:uncharacterized protein DIURU_002688 [Diutina rugosa]KAA8902792.1 hypothetical protein DIURU_002688 [Diutina rugosa]